MKTILTSFLLMIICSVNAQTLSIAETDAQIKKGDSLMKAGKGLLLEFICMQDTARHTKALANFAEAKATYDHAMANGTVTTNDWGMTTAQVLDAKIIIVKVYLSLYADSFREEIMAETPKERTKKVTYNGVEYKLTKDSKEHFETLNT